MMKSILAVALLFSVVSAAFSEKEYEVAFTNWMQENNKAYTAEEFKNRFAIFSDNMDFVEEWNSRPHSHKVGMNAMADLTNQEYQELYLMKNHIDASRRLAEAVPFTGKVSSPSDDDVNWVTKGAVTPIKDQGQCGSCWSFSTTGAIEGSTQITTGTLVSLSEQNLVDCSSDNAGCNGGEPTVAMQYVIDNKGIDLEDSYPAYTASQGQCRFEASWVGALITGYTQVSAGSEDDLKSKADEQPVSVAIDASHQSFQLYTSGIYNESNCSTSDLDHAVLVVGYGTDAADYWLVKNSWGTSWGLQGYIKMSRNADNQCGIASDAAISTGSSLPSTTSASANSNSGTSSGSSGQTSSGSSGQTSSGNSNSGNSATSAINTGKTASNTGKTNSNSATSQTSSSSSGQTSSGSSGQTSSGNSNSGNSATSAINTGKTASNTGKTTTTETAASSSSSSGQTSSGSSSGQTATSGSSGNTSN